MTIRFGRLLLGSLLLLSIALNFVNVVARYAFSAPIIWADEFLVFLVIWCVFIGAAMVTWSNEHLRIDIVTRLFSGRLRYAIALLSLTCSVGVAVFMAIQAYRVFALMAQTGQRSVAAGLPMTVPHLALLLGFTLIALVHIFCWRRELSGGNAIRDPDPEGH
jgi:TRAP-type C4-dicarboxylate transport system permease small subunit